MPFSWPRADVISSLGNYCEGPPGSPFVPCFLVLAFPVHIQSSALTNAASPLAEAPVHSLPSLGDSRVGVPGFGQDLIPSRFSTGAGESGKSTIVKQMK